MDYQAWAEQYRRTVKLWGWIPSIAQHWIEDLLRDHPMANVDAAWIALRGVRG